MNISLPKLNLPDFELLFRHDAGQNLIYDKFRKKYVVLTPEEWVRQNFLMYLVRDKKFPEGFIKVETKISLQKVWKRCDAVIYDRKLSPVVIVECKAPDVKISQEVFDQIGVYNSRLKVKYLIVTNGMQHYCCEIDYQSGSYRFLSSIPEFSDLIA